MWTGGEVGVMDIFQFTVSDVALLVFNIALILIRLHLLEKKVKELEGREVNGQGEDF